MLWNEENKNKIIEMNEFLDVRVMNILKNNNIKTVGDLLKYSRIDLLKLPNCGRKSLNRILCYLEDLGTTLVYRKIEDAVDIDIWKPFLDSLINKYGSFRMSPKLYNLIVENLSEICREIKWDEELRKYEENNGGGDVSFF